MEFFKSVFSDLPAAAAPTAAVTATATPDPSPPSSPGAPQNPQTTPPPASSWAFGSVLFQTLASKSETLIDNYYKDFQEFSTGLRKETSVIRQVGSRAIQDLPARLESGAALAQESLEAVGQAIDNVGSTVSEIIGKDLNFASHDEPTSSHSVESDRDLNFTGEPKTYNRMEAMIRALQCDIRTYSDEVEENGYLEWKMGFQIEEKRRQIEQLVEENILIMEIYNEIVPDKVDEETFWCRYFYRADKVIKAEEARARIVKKAILGDVEEEFSWDFDDADDSCNNENGESKLKDGESKLKDGAEKGKRIDKTQVENGDNKGVDISGTKNDEVLVDKNLGEKFIYQEKEVSDGKLGSDISIISSQRSSHTEDDLGWDEIEDIGSGDEIKMNKAVDLHKRLDYADKEEDEELMWDVEDDDEQPVKK